MSLLSPSFNLTLRHVCLIHPNETRSEVISKLQTMGTARLRSLPSYSGQATPAGSRTGSRALRRGCPPGYASARKQGRRVAGRPRVPDPGLRRQLRVCSGWLCRGTHRWETAPFSPQSPPSACESEAFSGDDAEAQPRVFTPPGTA